ncbi:MAG: 50S ribosomal protein L34 [Candidatus Moeniiplasma glomeromycotorum]|nr:50S ribosomal protein L34 [Candidatus Moeniiplasma glomeromycotorum]
MKRPYQPSKIKRAHKHGYRHRKEENQDVLWRRRQKGRRSLSI